MTSTKLFEATYYLFNFDGSSVVHCIVSRGQVNSGESRFLRSLSAQESICDNSDAECDETVTQVNSSSVNFSIISQWQQQPQQTVFLVCMYASRHFMCLILHMDSTPAPPTTWPLSSLMTTIAPC